MSSIVDEAVEKARGSGRPSVWSVGDVRMAAEHVEAHYLALLKEAEERRDDALKDYAQANEERKMLLALLVDAERECAEMQARLHRVVEGDVIHRAQLAVAVETLRAMAHGGCASPSMMGADCKAHGDPPEVYCTPCKASNTMARIKAAGTYSSAGETIAVTHQPESVPATAAAESVREGSAGVTPGSGLIPEASAGLAGRSSSHADDWTCPEATKRALPTHHGFPWWCCAHNTDHCYVCHGTGRAPEKETP